MRGPESFRNKWLFLVYRQMVLSKDSVGLKCCEPLDDLVEFRVDLVGFSHVVGYYHELGGCGILHCLVVTPGLHLLIVY